MVTESVLVEEGMTHGWTLTLIGIVCLDPIANPNPNPCLIQVTYNFDCKAGSSLTALVLCEAEEGLGFACLDPSHLAELSQPCSTQEALRDAEVISIHPYC